MERNHNFWSFSDNRRAEFFLKTGRFTVKNVMPTNQTIRLNHLPFNICGIVRDIEFADEETQRLKALGIYAGRRVELIRDGDPLIVKVFNTRLGISASLGMRIHVEICVPSDCIHEQKVQ